MKQKLLTLFLALVASAGIMFASDIQVDGIWYDFDESNKTATVTYRGSSYGSYNNEYSGSVVIPPSVTYNGVTYSVTSIGERAFYRCSSLTSITIPNSVTSIGDYTFRNCSSLTSVTIPNSVTSIGYRAFAYCSSLTSITIPNSVTGIGEGAFKNCSSLTTVTIGNSVTSIEYEAFAYCSSLTSITIPNSVTSIGNYAFDGCSSLTSVTWNAKNCADFSSSSYAPFYDIRTQITSFDFGDNVEHIPAYLCYGMNKLTSITITKSVTSIGSEAFYGTGIYANEDNWENDVLYVNDCLIDAKTSISGAYAIKEGTRVIAGYAFYRCSSLTSVTIPNSVTSIGRMAFAYDDALVAINIEQGNRAYSSVDGVLYNRNKTVIIAYPTGKTNNSYTILEGVNTIDSCAFIGNEYLEYINMPKTLISIDYGAFANCTKLIKIVIPKTVRSIGYRAFYNCASLKKIYNNAIIPQEIDDQTFEKVDILNCELYVMPMAFTNYYNANIWKNFGLIETIEIGGIDIDDSKLEFTTTQKQANVLWAANSKATLYLLSMRRVGSEDTYTFTFDENGYLISSDTNSLDFSKLIYLQNAAYSLTITDFDTDATYVYSFLYKDNEGNILHSESGQFSLDEFPEGIENVQGNEVQSTKVIKDGQVLILRGEKVYTIDGRKVR